jgi:multidrug efflux system membrane fusion protein
MRVLLILFMLVTVLVAPVVFFQLPADGLNALVPSALRSTGASRQSRADNRSAITVAAAGVAKEDVPVYLTGIGTVQAYNTVNVRSRVDGEIKQILFVEGQDVTTGDTLAIIDQRPFQAQLRQQEAIRLKDLALLRGAQLDLKRAEALVLKQVASQQQLDQQEALVDQYRAQVQNDEAQIEYARTQLEYTTIRAPISGRVGVRQIDVGNIVRVGDNTIIVVITQLQPISVIFTLPAAALAQARLAPGRTDIAAAALAFDKKLELDHGQVELIDNQVDQATGTIKLKATFPNKRLRLWPGDFVNGRLTVDTRKGGLTVPTAAIRHGPAGDYVWVVQPDMTVELRPVLVGQTFASRVLVERGLNGNELVVTDGHYRLQNRSVVEITKSDTRISQTEPR